MTKSDLISVVIPVHNGADFLQPTIQSCLSQKNLPVDLEIIIVNDASTDSTPELLSELAKYDSINVIHFEKNKGVAAARNQGIKSARGNYIAFLDADDVMEPDKLAIQYAEFQQNPNVDFIFTAVNHVHDNGEFCKAYVIDYPAIQTDRLKAVFLGHISSFTSSIIFRKNAVDKLGYMEESFRHLEDHDYLLRAIDKLNVKYLPEPLSIRRLSNQGLSYSISKEQFIETRTAFKDRILKYYPALQIHETAFWAEAYFGLGRLYQKNRQRFDALKMFYKSITCKYSKSAVILLVMIALPWKMQTNLEMRRWQPIPSRIRKLLDANV